MHENTIQQYNNNKYIIAALLFLPELSEMEHRQAFLPVVVAGVQQDCLLVAALVYQELGILLANVQVLLLSQPQLRQPDCFVPVLASSKKW